jgi:hypothetical protein
VTRPEKPPRRTRGLLTAVAGLALLALAMTSCSSNNRRVSVGGSVMLGSGGSWGHNISVGIHSHRVRN